MTVDEWQRVMHFGASIELISDSAQRKAEYRESEQGIVWPSSVFWPPISQAFDRTPLP